MNRETKMATYWTAGGIALVAVALLIAWWAGVFDVVPK